MGTGATLKRERLAQGLSLEEIAAQTRISLRFLEAIEREELEKLPGLVFARNFVRQYAGVLKLDPEPLLGNLPKVDLETTPLPDPAVYAKPRESSRLLAAASSGIWIVLAAAAIAGAYLYIERPKSLVAGSQPVTAGVPAASVPVASGPVTSGPVTQTAPAVPTPVAVTPAASVAQEQPAPLTEAVEGRPVKVVLKAREASWVQIFADGKMAFTGMLHANDSRIIGANSLVKVTAGNAGGIEISLNGKSLDPLGTTGQVRTVRLTAEGPEFVSRTPAPSPL